MAAPPSPTLLRCERFLASTCLALLLLTGGLCADEIKRRADAPQPLPPEESVKRFQLPDDLEVKLVAAEPLLADPSCVAWDEHGRLYVSEIHGYNLEGHLDIQKLNKTGKLDKQIRRIPASDEDKAAAEEQTYGTIRLLEDTNNDGVMDKSTVYADKLPPCFGMVTARGGLIAVGRPEIIFLADRDGDGKAEVRETLFHGFGITILERSINNPRWGIDNWIYVSAGREGGRISGPHLAAPVTLGATDFRFLPDGSAIEAVTGRNSMFGQTMTDWGDRFVTPPGNYAIPIPQRYLARNPYLPAPGVNAGAASGNRVYPSSQPHPWRVERSQSEAWREFYGAGEATANGFFTSTCGQMIYRAGWFPERFHGNQFCCEPAQNLVHRRVLRREGLRFRADRAAEEQQSEFLTSTDQWFRPNNLLMGPDSAMYIVDMYREIIEDYSAIPRYLQQQYGLMEGNDHGRIWRVVPKDQPAAEVPVPALADIAGQVALLSHPNAWQRLTAQRLLVEAEDASCVPLLQQMLQNGPTPQARLHALYALAGLSRLTASDVMPRLEDDHFALRVHALRQLEPWLDNESALQAAFKLVNDPDIKVRLQLTLSLGEAQDAKAVEALAEIIRRDGGDSWMQAAVLSSVADTADGLLSTLIASPIDHTEEAERIDQLLQPLASMIGSRGQADEVQLVLNMAADRLKQHPRLQERCLAGLAEGLERSAHKDLAITADDKSLPTLVASSDDAVRTLAVRIAKATGSTNTPQMTRLFRQAADTATDDTKPQTDRMAAIHILEAASEELLTDTAAALLDSQQSSSLQFAAISALEANTTSQTAELLLDHWPQATPAVRHQILDTLFAHVDHLPHVLAALEHQTLAANSLSAVQRNHLLEHSSEDLRQRAKAVLSSTTTTISDDVLQRYQAALEATADVAHGKVLFEKTCAVCHTVNQSTIRVGPDLSVIQTRTDETVLLDILQPSAKISSGFDSYLVVDTRGRSFTGILASESVTSVTLRSAAAATTTTKAQPPTEQTILRKDIDELRASAQSLMPDRLHEQLSPQDIVDVIAWIRSSLRRTQLLRVVLFDDDDAFPAQLTRGEGTARLERLNPFSGNSALHVSPPQRYSASIPDWKFRIRENPAEGEYRWLRLAWKTAGAHGVLVELAADGHWPDSSDAARRYYSGKNSTNWAANQVSPKVPVDWTVITCDLWKDCGDFTLTGIAPTAMGGNVLFDRIELLRSLEHATD